MIFRTFFLLAWLGAGIAAYGHIPNRAEKPWYTQAAMFAFSVVAAPVYLGFKAFEIMEAIGD